MENENKAKKNMGVEANVKINPNAFIRQVSVAGNKTEMAKSTDADIQSDDSNLDNTVEAETMVELKPIEEKFKEFPRKKKSLSAAIDYESVFLTKNEIRNRQGLYIGKDNYESLQSLVRSIRSERLSVSGLVDNIVKHHIELYGEEINRIFEENIQKPIKITKTKES